MEPEFPFDPELLYVECSECGEPILWEEGKTRELLIMSGADPHDLDLSCMILSEGCPLCQPDDPSYITHIIRLTNEGSKEYGTEPVL